MSFKISSRRLITLSPLSLFQQTLETLVFFFCWSSGFYFLDRFLCFSSLLSDSSEPASKSYVDFCAFLTVSVFFSPQSFPFIFSSCFSILSTKRSRWSSPDSLGLTFSLFCLICLVLLLYTIIFSGYLEYSGSFPRPFSLLHKSNFLIQYFDSVFWLWKKWHVLQGTFALAFAPAFDLS